LRQIKDLGCQLYGTGILMPDGSATAHLYQPKLLTVAAEGYSLDHFRKDVTAALTVAIVAGCVLAALLAVFHRSVAEEGA
jgi:hypothetical protein